MDYFSFRFIAAALCVFTIVVVPIRSQVPGFGNCPNYPVQPNFDANAYLGQWYEYEKYPFIFQFGGKCTTATYGLANDGRVTVLNRQINKFTERETTISGFARIIAPAKLLVSFPAMSFAGESPYWVLATDYNNFAIVWSCTSFGGFVRTSSLWILTRAAHPSPQIVNRAYSIIDSLRISRALMIKTEQSCTAKNLRW